MSENETTVKARNSLLDAALSFVESAAALPGVERIALIGSLLTDRPSPKDVDLLVFVIDDADLAPLALVTRRLKGRLQSQNRGADVFFADERGRYLGRICSWKVCRPGVRASCDALHCGRRPYLHDDLATIRLDGSLIAAPPLQLWPTVVRRGEIPPDVDVLVRRLEQPHNKPFYLTPGGRSVRRRRTAALTSTRAQRVTGAWDQAVQVAEIATLWDSDDENEWLRALDRYWEYVKPANLELERAMEALDPPAVEALDGQGWYDFLLNKYFVGKYTAAHRYASTTKHLKLQAAIIGLDGLGEIKRRIFATAEVGVREGLVAAMTVKGLGPAGASGRLALLFPTRFPMIGWSSCPAVERDPERVSGAWVFRGTRVPVAALCANLEDGALVSQFVEWFRGVTMEQVRTVLEHAARSAVPQRRCGYSSIRAAPSRCVNR